MEDLNTNKADNEEIRSEQEEKLSVMELIRVFFWALVIIIPIKTFIFQPFFVQGASMEPNFHDGEYLIVNELGYKKTSLEVGGKNIFTVNPTKDFSRGDVVIFRYPVNPKQHFIKRIVGLPGEKVEIKDKHVIIYNKENPNGFVLDEEEYLPSFTATKIDQTVELSNEEFFVLGDNRGHSSDSREWGPLGKDYVVGKVLIRAWPFTKFDIFE